MEGMFTRVPCLRQFSTQLKLKEVKGGKERIKQIKGRVMSLDCVPMILLDHQCQFTPSTDGVGSLLY